MKRRRCFTDPRAELGSRELWCLARILGRSWRKETASFAVMHGCTLIVSENLEQIPGFEIHFLANLFLDWDIRDIQHFETKPKQKTLNLMVKTHWSPVVNGQPGPPLLSRNLFSIFMLSRGFNELPREMIQSTRKGERKASQVLRPSRKN